MFLFPNVINRARSITGTGNPKIDHDVAELVTYYKSVFDKYTRCLQTINAAAPYVNKTVVELGPGDTIGIALLFLAHGAAQVICCDRFKLITNIKKNTAIARNIMQRLPDEQKQELRKCISFNNSGHVEWDASRLKYLFRTDHVRQIEKSSVDIIVSNAVLEHVHNLESLFATMSYVMKPDGFMVHAADLGSHGLHYATPLDFLAIPETLWKFMTYYRGAPNRARKSYYEQLSVLNGFKILQWQTTQYFTQEEKARFKLLHPAVATSFSDDDLSCASMLFAAQKKVR